MYSEPLPGRFCPCVLPPNALQRTLFHSWRTCSGRHPEDNWAWRRQSCFTRWPYIRWETPPLHWNCSFRSIWNRSRSFLSISAAVKPLCGRSWRRWTRPSLPFRALELSWVLQFWERSGIFSAFLLRPSCSPLPVWSRVLPAPENPSQPREGWLSTAPTICAGPSAKPLAVSSSATKPLPHTPAKSEPKESISMWSARTLRKNLCASSLLS